MGQVAAGAVDCPIANNYTLVQESANIMFYIILNIMKKMKALTAGYCNNLTDKYYFLSNWTWR